MIKTQFLSAGTILIILLFPGCTGTPDHHDGYLNDVDRQLCERIYDTQTCYQNYVLYAEHERAGGCYIKEGHEAGSSNESNVIPVDIYLLNIEKPSETQIDYLFAEVNSIWSGYGIRFEINSISRVKDKGLDLTVYNGFNDDEVLGFLQGVAPERITPKDDNILDLILVDECKIRCMLEQLIKREKLSYKGQGTTLSDGTRFVQLRYSSENNTWLFSHEVAHLLNLEDIPSFMGEYNLMTHLGCIKKTHPTVLEQEQVNRAVDASKHFQNESQNNGTLQIF